ncbi:hypothetical protein HOH30_00455 [Candidatus Woesearchaeota archaeon]|nr:hypothetical protein [Candidatus Woesearchaeota archaeon]
MKHSRKVTLLLLLLFILAQCIGIGILYKYIDVDKSAETGETTLKDGPYGERPQLEETTSYIYVMLAIIIGTFLMLFIIKKQITWLWKFWFLFAVLLALWWAFTPFVTMWLALLLASVLAVWKIFRPNFIIQTTTEMFMYGGLAAIFVPLFSIWSVSILMVLIALYDAYAVWKSKHMITLAKSQTKAKVFAGLLIPYNASGKKLKKSSKKVKVKTAMLGGGDIGFPLIFAGVVLKEFGLWQSFSFPFLPRSV